MKVLFCLLAIILVAPHSFAQTYRVPVGVDSAIYNVNYIHENYAFCVAGKDSCGYVFNGMTFVDGSILHEPFHMGTKLNGPAVFFYPFDARTYIDTFKITYHIAQPGTKCADCQTREFTYEYPFFTSIAYYDSTLKIRPQSNGYYFKTDTGAVKKYAPVYDSSALLIFNNFPDSVILEECSYAVDNTAKVTMAAFKDSVPVNKVAIQGKSYISIAFSLQSGAALLPNGTYFDGVVTLRMRHQNTDTTILYNLFSEFDNVASSVVSVLEKEQSMKINPNPSTGLIVISYSQKSPGMVHLDVLDELGKEIKSVYTGMLPEGKRDFSFKLPQGMYYVRMETAEGVVSKKIIVQ
ncbi:MAG: T9SS type A sorting domain-containing protein [Candidatus Kapaibacterium sp.]